MLPRPITILIADQYALSAKSLSALLSKYSQLKIVGDVRSTDELLLLLEERVTNLALIDSATLTKGGEISCTELGKYYPETTLIAMVPEGESRETPTKLKDFGIGHAISKQIDPTAFVNKLYSLVFPVTVNAGPQIGDQAPSNLKQWTISAREREVIILLAKGLKSPMIAEKLFISINTVKQHRKNIFQKLNVSNVQELVAFAIRNDLEIE